MASIKLNNLSTNILKEDIINNNIKEIFTNSNIYNTLIANPNTNIVSLVHSINNDIDSLNNSLVKFDLYLNNYINDYLNIDNYLSFGTHNNINSIPTQNVLYNIEKLDNIKLENFNVPTKILTIDYEMEFDDEEKKESE